MKGTIAIVAPDESNLEGLLEFAPDDVEVKWIDSSQPVDVKAEQMSDVAALFNAGGPLDMELVRRCPRLRLIQSTSAGVDGFDLAALAEIGVQVANNRGGNAITVAEHAVALMVAALRKLVLQFEAIRAGKWFGKCLRGLGLSGARDSREDCRHPRDRVHRAGGRAEASGLGLLDHLLRYRPPTRRGDRRAAPAVGLDG